MIKRLIKQSPVWVIPLLVGCLLCPTAFAGNSVRDFSATASSGSVTWGVDYTFDYVGVINVTLVSDATGDCVVTTSPVSGLLDRIIYTYITDVSPELQYDLLITDEDSVTVAGGANNNLESATPTVEIPVTATVVSGATHTQKKLIKSPLTFTGANFGATDTVRVKLFLSNYH